eukprot:CAMPEP_0201580394 /NCGR_PEP_ID=MMETSP0190_2-20130828/44549_1 /ASSEMBLY_ACC=CAM_ASM_000263 /TAXON_ID=37353 /ORGANISM="Rosalina sp." /LENGTH=172 /DNA_ID=CAMNT_0048016337 /DNA_START=68 /DNA_END=586 /DNA_ORIENTATION=+
MNSFIVKIAIFASLIFVNHGIDIVEIEEFKVNTITSECNPKDYQKNKLYLKVIIANGDDLNHVLDSDDSGNFYVGPDGKVLVVDWGFSGVENDYEYDGLFFQIELYENMGWFTEDKRRWTGDKQFLANYQDEIRDNKELNIEYTLAFRDPESNGNGIGCAAYLDVSLKMKED